MFLLSNAQIVKFLSSMLWFHNACLQWWCCSVVTEDCTALGCWLTWHTGGRRRNPFSDWYSTRYEVKGKTNSILCERRQEIITSRQHIDTKQHWAIRWGELPRCLRKQWPLAVTTSWTLIWHGLTHPHWKFFAHLIRFSGVENIIRAKWCTPETWMKLDDRPGRGCFW